MKKIIYSLFAGMSMFCLPAFSADTFSCGDGYILVSHSKIDGINAMECEKLWCMDLETGKKMGNGNTAAAGYRATDEPVLLEDDKGNEIRCFGDRKWCAGETAGVWNPEFGGYTRGGGDTVTYKSYQKSGCFAWRLEKPDCESGKTAVLQNGEWVCVSAVGQSDGGRASTIRRTGNIRYRK